MVCVKRKWGEGMETKDICENENVFTTLKEAMVEQMSTLMNVSKVLHLHMDRSCCVIYSM
jgi:hypothetical protein